MPAARPLAGTRLKMDGFRVLILGDDPLTRAGLAAVLSPEPDMQVVGQMEAREDWGRNVDQFDPHVIIWDLGWDLEDGAEEVLDLLRELPPVLALVPDESQVYRLWISGVRGALRRDGEAGALAAAARAVAQGLAAFDPSLLRSVVSSEEVEGAEMNSPLSPREMDVLHLLADGLSNRAIASELVISEHTVKFHVNSIMSKLNAESRTEAVVIAMRAGIISL